MVEGFVPPSPEQVNDRAKEAQKPGEDTRLSQEAFRPRDVQRVGDQGDRPRDPAQVYQAVFSELTAAKQGMLGVNDIISKGGGPYAQGDGFKAYQTALDSAQQHYTNARLAADTFLYVCDKQGNPVMDRNGNPVPSKENLALRQQQAQMDQEMQKLAQDKSPAGQQRLQQMMEQSHMISDVLRSSGYARANNAFALMFHSGDLQGQDRKNFGKTGNALLGMASKFDPAMWGPPPDANFMKHYNQAMDVLMGGGTDQPSQPPRPGDVQPNLPPRPADQAPPVPADQTQVPKPVDQTQPPRPTDQTQPQNTPVVAEGNQYFINYRGLHLPTWTEKNPDGSASQSFAGVRDVKQPDGSVKQEPVSREKGMLKTVSDAQGNVLGVDAQPLKDKSGLRRIGDNGMPVPAQFDATDPSVMQAQLERAINGPLNDQTRAAYNKVIESADKLDRVSMARAMEKNEDFIKKNPEAFQWESSYRQLNKQLGDIFNDLGKFRQGLNPAQVDGLNKMWGNVTSAQDIDKWINDPANKASKDALTADPQKWAAIKSKYGDYLNKEAEIKAKETELAQKPDLLNAVRNVRAADAMNQELTRLFASSLDTRAGYAARLLDEDSVKKYKAVADKNSPEAKALENDANVKEVKRVLAELAKTSPQMAARLDQTGKSLGLDMAKLAPQPPKPADQTQPPKPVDQTQPPKPVDQAQPPKPADQSQPPKPADQQQRTSAELSQDQSNAPQVLNDIYGNYLKVTEGATKPMKAEDFAQVAPAWEKALDANSSIKKEQLDTYEKQAQEQFGNQVAMALALQKTGKTSFDQLVPDDLNKFTQDELKAAMTSSVQQWTTVSNNLAKAQQALTPELKQKYIDAEKKFQTAMEAAQKDAGTDKAKLQAAYQTAYTAKLNEQKALNPDLAKAIDARSAFLDDAKGVFAKQYMENMALIDSYKHVDEARIQYAQALNLQGGDENKAKAVKMLTEAMKNPAAADLLQKTTDGVKLLTDLKLKTPDMTKLEDEQDKLFPEMNMAKQATDLLADKTKDPKQAWKDADALFKKAEEAIDKEIMEKGQGNDLAHSLNKINQIVEQMKLQLAMAMDNFKNDRTKLPGPDGPQKDADAKIVKDVLLTKGTGPNGQMTQLDMVQALMGNKGPALQAAMQRILTDTDRQTLNNMAVLAQKAQNVSLIRMQHALKASEYGFKNNDDSAKAAAKSLVEGIHDVELELQRLDPTISSISPEVIGALKQAEQGRQMDLSGGKAATIAFSEAAKDTITKTQMGLVDWVVPGASLGLNSLGAMTTGHYISEVPVVGALFGGSKEATAKLVDQLAMAQLSNAAEAQVQRDQTVNDGNKQLRGIAGDVTGVGSTFLAGWGANKGIQYLVGEAPLPGYAKVGIGLGVGIFALGTGGVVNNAVSGNDLLASRGFIRNGVAAGTTYAAIKGLQYLPTNAALSEGTVAKLGLEPGTEITSSQLSRALSAEANVGKNTLEKIAAAAPSRVNPINWTPFRFAAPAEGKSAWNLISRFQFAGYGGERTAALLADGAMSLTEFNTRQFASKTLLTFAGGYGFGALNKGAAIYTGEHLDGKKYDTLSSYLTDMNSAGLSTGLTSSFLIPVVGKTMVPGSWQTGIGNGVNNLFARVPGIDAAAATTALGSASLFWARPGLDATQRWGEATIYDNIYQQAQKRAQELRDQASKQLQPQPQATDKPAEQKK